jgi:2-polyprenyl-3-methyl-5-hydroxy-6-metoxy-1,4-benzoquinol methylase
MYLTPRLAEQEIIRLYQDQDYFISSVSGQGYDEYLDVRQNWIKTFRLRLRQIGRYKPSGRVLDVGCGPGFFLEAALEMGYDAFGLDPSDYIVQRAQDELGQRIYKGTLETVDFDPQSFDLIVAFDTFEHIYHPLLWLETVHRLLKPEGVLAITTPNPESLLSRLSGKGWVSFKIPEHVFYWSPKTIQVALEKNFQLLEILRAGQYATLGFLFRRVFKLSEVGGLMQLVIERLNRISIYANNGSMTVVAKKRS